MALAILLIVQWLTKEPVPLVTFQGLPQAGSPAAHGGDEPTTGPDRVVTVEAFAVPMPTALAEALEPLAVACPRPSPKALADEVPVKAFAAPKPNAFAFAMELMPLAVACAAPSPRAEALERRPVVPMVTLGLGAVTMGPGPVMPKLA